MPAFTSGNYKEDPHSGTFLVVICDRQYVTEGIIGIEVSHNLVWCRSYKTDPYSTPREEYYSSHENTLEDTYFLAEHIQKQYLAETGIVFPIYVKG